MNKLHPQGRYLLCRPHGGLNDTLVQLEKCRRYAARHQRTLIVDFHYSGLRLPFEEIFLPTGDFGCPVFGWSDERAAELDAIASLRPASLVGQVAARRHDWDRSASTVLVADTKDPVTFDMGQDHPEQLLVHEQAGGGSLGVQGLRHLILAPALADAVARRLAPLGGDYDAIHVRHSDITTDYRRLFDRCRPIFANRKLLVCSDGVEVIDHARRALGSGTAVMTVSDIPDTQGVGLHLLMGLDARQGVVDLFSDLLGMARSRRFIFAPLTSSTHFRARFSGLSVLVELMRLQPAIIHTLLGRVSPDLRAALFDAPATPQRPSLRSRLAVLDQWRWNFGARWLSMRYAIKLKMETFSPWASPTRKRKRKRNLSRSAR